MVIKSKNHSPLQEKLYTESLSLVANSKWFHTSRLWSIFSFQGLNIVVIAFILLFSHLNISAQDNNLLKGQFTGENLEKSFINVININQYKATISQLDGKFKIEAKVGDSILISSIQYSEIKFVVKPEFFEEGLEIPLKLKVNELLDVNIYSLGLTGDLSKDAENIKTKDFDQTKLGFPPVKELPAIEERRINAATSSTIDYLLNALNGDLKLYRILQKNALNEKKKRNLYYTFPLIYYTDDLNIPKLLVEDFLYYCIENHPKVANLIKESNKLLLIELLPELAKKYMKIKESEKDKTQTIDD